MPAQLLGVRKTEIPYFGAWLGHWAIESRYAEGLRAELATLNLSDHLRRVSSESPADSEPMSNDRPMSRDDLSQATELGEWCYALIDGVAILNVNGPLTKHRSSWGGSCSTLELRRQIRHAAKNPDVLGLALFIESPGGTVSGIHELASDLAAFDKPKLAYCSDLCASAAYWAACQCDEIVANAPALVGSIGTYCVVADCSAAFAEAGVAIHVVKAGAHKGDFTPGTEITEEQLATLQADIDGINAFFLAAVEKGRGMSSGDVKAVADGRAHLSAAALKLGLIDAIEPWDAAFERFAARVNGDEETDETEDPTEPDDMTTESTKSKPATLAELESAFPKASATWRASCIERNFTLAEATSAYVELLEARNAALVAETKGTKGVAGVGVKIKGKKGRKARAEDDSKECEDDEEEMSAEDDELESEDDELLDEMTDEEEEDEEDSVVAKWNAAFARELKACHGDRRRAFLSLSAKNPGLRRAFMEAKNAQSQRAKRLNAAAAQRATAARNKNAVRR